MKVGIIGAGEISRYHLQVLKEIKAVDVCAICDPDLSRANTIGDLFDIKGRYENHNEMIAREKPDVVHVLTPPKFHAQISIEALENGCHVLVEKPMALSYEDALRMVSTAKKTGKHLTICEMFLFDPVIIRARDMVQAGQIGKIVHVENYWFADISVGSNAYSFKGGGTGWALSLPGGVFANFLDHPVYLQREFIENISSVSTTCKKIGLNPFISCDELRVNLSGDDKTGYIVSSLNGKPRINYLRLYGTEGILTADMSNLTITTLKNSRLPSFLSKGFNNLSQSYELLRDTVKTTSLILTKKIRARQSLRNFVNEFYSRLNGSKTDINDSLILNCEKGSETIRILEEIWNSMPKYEESEINLRDKSYINHSCTDSKGAQPGLNPRKALVTGAGGFLGGNLVKELLKKDYIVRVILRNINEGFEKSQRAEVLYGDIRDPRALEKAVEGVDEIYHCAAIASNKGQWQNFIDTNVNATRDLLDLAVKFNLNRFVFISSVVVYGFNKNDEDKAVSENDDYATDLPYYSYYAKSKIEAEKLVWDYYNRKGLPVTVIRPGIIYGPGGKNIFKRGKIIFGAKNKRLPYIYVKDVVDAMILAGTSNKAPGNAYNVVCDEHPAQNEFNKKLTQLSGNKSGMFLPIPVMAIPAYMLEFIFKQIMPDSAPPLGVFFYKSLIRDMKYNNNKIKTELGWKPKSSLEDGLKKTYEYFSES
jgi:nucleoside-diphosphate-sugar epimerase/predicted dehydrogenase